MRAQILVVLALTMLLTAPFAALAEPNPTVTIQVLNVADWHAQLDPLSGFGGAAVLSTYFQQARASNPNTITLTGGDAYGASPPLSGFFNETPAIEAMNLMGFDADTFGNHNFDRGLSHLQSMIDRASFPYVVSNLVDAQGELAGVQPYTIVEHAGVKVAIIGVLNPEAPELVFPGNFGNITIADPDESAMSAKSAAQAAGAEVFVLVGHMGVTGRDHNTGAWQGPLVRLAENVTGFDLILGDHTDIRYNATINGQLVLEVPSKGIEFNKVQLTFDTVTRDVVGISFAQVRASTSGITPDPAIQAMLAPYRTQLAAIFDEKIGETTGVFPRGNNVERLGENALGNLVGDAIRLEYGAQLAFNNGGGIRAALPSSYVPQAGGLQRSGCTEASPCDLVVGDVYTVLPFGNSVVVRPVTGWQLYEAMEWGLGALPAANGRFPQISGFTVVFDSEQPSGQRVEAIVWHPDTSVGDLYQEATIPCPDAAPSEVCTKDAVVKGRPGIPIARDNSTTYTLATNNFVNAGGDGYRMLADGLGETREVMADVLLEHIRDAGTITPRLEDRILDLAAKRASLPLV